MKRITNYKNKLHKRSKTEKDLYLKNDLINEHKILQRNLRKELQLEKDRYYHKFFKENKNNLIKVWQNIKNLINFKTKTRNNNMECRFGQKSRFLFPPVEIYFHRS